jgi:hypothetical protein
MDQAVNASIPPASNGQPAGDNGLTIAALAARWAQLSESATSTSDATLDQQTALQDVILATEPRGSDEALALVRIVGDELESAGLHQLASTMASICRALERSGAKDLLVSEQQV